jgi:hypothetical protein
MTPTEFAELRLMPLVLAFAAGVIVATVAAGPREARTVTVNDNLLISIECLPEVEGAPVWAATGGRP